MQTLNYVVGPWHAEARVEEMEAGKLMAVVCVTDEKGIAGGGSRHTIVFDHQAGKDARKATEAEVQRILHERYGAF